MSNKRELDNKKKIKYTLWLTPEEEKLLSVKAKQYGYKYKSAYLRDAGLYENVVQIDISYTDKVSDLFQECIDEIRKFTKEVRRVLKYDTSATPEERDMIQQTLYRVYSQTKSLKKSVNDNINVKEIIKQSKERLYKQQLQEIEDEFNIIINE